jgi:hypothetical protein
MTADNRRRTGVFTAIVADPWRKGLAIALAVLLWFFIDSRIMRTVPRTLQLVTVGERQVGGVGLNQVAVALNTDQVVGKRFLDGEQQIDKVQVKLTGPRYKVSAFEKGLLDLRVTSFLGVDWEGRGNVVEFTAADLRRDQFGFENIDIEFVPSRIVLEVERIAERTVPLTLDRVDIDGSLLANRLRRDTAEFAPTEAVVLGPAISIDRFTRRPGKPFRAVVQGTTAGAEKQVTLPLEIVDGQELGLRFKTQPLLTMQVLPQTTKFELELPIVVDDLALPPELRGTYQPVAKTRTVRIAAGGALRAQLINVSEGGDKARLAEWAAANLRLWVHIPKPEGVGYPPELDRTARLLPVGKLSETVDRNECLLDEAVVVNLRRQP